MPTDPWYHTDLGRPRTVSDPVAIRANVLKQVDLSEEPKNSPYDVKYMPVRLADELRAIGVFPAQTGSNRDGRFLEEADKAISVGTRLPPAVLYAIDRLIERRVYNFRSRQELLRAAVTQYVCELADLLQQDMVRLSIWRLNQARRLVAEIEMLGGVEEMIALTRKSARRLIEYGNRLGAIQALRTAKRFAEDLPLDGLRNRVSAGLYGAATGIEKPEGWELDEVALLWERVEDGELDKDDSEIVAEQVKLV